MNFQQLEYALAVHRHKNFGKAADSCHVTQATLSAMVKKLEDELGTQLFDRSRPPVYTTEDGLRFVKIAEDIIRKRDDLLAINETVPIALEGEVRLGIIPTIASSLLPLVLPTIRQEHPDLTLSIHEVTTEETIQLLKTDELDIGILATPVNDDLIDEHILYYEAMLVYGIDDQEKTYVSSADVKNGKIWLLEEGHCFRNQALTVCDVQEKSDSSEFLKFEGSSFETLLSLTDSFGGFTLVPELYHNDLPKRRKARCKPFKSPIPVREISMVSARPHTNRHVIEKLSYLIRTLVKPKLRTSKMANKELDIIGI